jgi:hypothetical protein
MPLLVASGTASAADVMPRATAARTVCEATLAHPEAGALPFALASLWLDERVDEGNERLREWFRTGHRTEEAFEVLL